MIDLKQELKKRGFNGASFAQSIGVTRQAINNVIHGSRPSIELAKKIAQALNIDWWELYK